MSTDLRDQTYHCSRPSLRSLFNGTSRDYYYYLPPPREIVILQVAPADDSKEPILEAGTLPPTPPTATARQVQPGA